METYLFQGLILPERAPVSLKAEIPFTHYLTGHEGVAKISVLLNQVTMWIEIEEAEDVLTLRNLARNLLETNLAIFGFVTGRAYNVEITRVVNQAQQIDYVFGVDIPCLVPSSEEAAYAEFYRILAQVSGEAGLLLHRCFMDLKMAMQIAEDTGFYCYRAVESLRRHRGNALGIKEKAPQWNAFREFAHVNEADVRKLKDAADELRHGGVGTNSATDNQQTLELTWRIVRAYVSALTETLPSVADQRGSEATAIPSSQAQAT